VRPTAPSFPYARPARVLPRQNFVDFNTSFWHVDCVEGDSRRSFPRRAEDINAVPEGSTAFSQRDANYLFHPIAVWKHAADDERVLAAGRAFAGAMRPFANGSPYLNFTPEADRVHDAYTGSTYARLVALKDKYDRDNLFQLNQNIAPTRKPQVVGFEFDSRTAEEYAKG
jgi:berberine-like enzyme